MKKSNTIHHSLGLSAAEYADRMFPYREALLHETLKTSVPVIVDLTIRTVNDYWVTASDGVTAWPESLDQLKTQYDIDDPDDCYRWIIATNQKRNLAVGQLTLLPEIVHHPHVSDVACQCADWVLCVRHRCADPFVVAQFVKRLQDNNVAFRLYNANDVYDDFTKAVAAQQRRLTERR